MKTVLVLIAAVLLSVSAYAGNDKKDKEVKRTTNNIEVVQEVNLIDITGSVVDNKSKELLAGASIFIDGNKYYSDLDGNFAITNVKPGKYTVMVELISYQPSEIEVDLQKNEKLNINLVQK